MKNHFLLILMFTLLSGTLFSQKQQFSPTIVKKADYFDKTPPLRDMKIIMPGERKRAWKNGEIGNESVKFGLNGGENTNPELYNYLQQQKGKSTSRGPKINIKGVGNVNSVYPPDTDGDVGPDHYFQMINLSFAIWDKDGNKLYGPVDNSTLWQGFIGAWTGTNDGDPIVLYDELADRWIASQFAIYTSNGKYYQLVAVSESGDPLGAYYRYAFEFDQFNDYPKLGVWPDGYYVTFNFFDNGFAGAGIAAFEREKMLVGDEDAQMVFFGPYPDKFSLQPSDVDGQAPPAGSPNFIATVNTFGSKQLEIFEFSVDWENTSNSTYSLGVSLNPGYFNPNFDGIPQPNTSQKLDVLSQMLMFRLAYRNFGDYQVMLANHTVNVSGRAGIKWYELRLEEDNWFIYQQGVYAPNDGLNRWMGSIVMNADGKIALGYSVSSNSVFPSIRYTGRSPDAPPGEMNYEEIEVVSGTTSQSGISRWGDYSCISVDPADDTTFWFTNEYHHGGWRTRIISFDFAPLQPPEVFAGPDDIVCQNTLFTTDGSVNYGKSWQWSSSGDGMFATPFNLVTYYMHGAQDIENGQAILTLTAQGYGQGMVSTDDMILGFTKLPLVDAGDDTTINSFTTYTTCGHAENYEAVAWTTAGDGFFADTSELQTIYTPGEGDIANGSVKLTLTAAPLDPCSASDSDDVNITLDPLIGIDIPENNKSEIEILPNPSGGEFTIKMYNVQNKNCTLNILNSGSDIIFTEKIQTGKDIYTRSFDFKYLPAGVYFAKLQTGSSAVVEKIIIR